MVDKWLNIMVLLGTTYSCRRESRWAGLSVGAGSSRGAAAGSP